MSPSPIETRFSEPRALAYTHEWIAAWNAHDLDRIMGHYGEPLDFTSPLVRERYPQSDGTIRDLVTLRAYFGAGLASAPTLSFTLLEVLRSVGGFVMLYVNARGGHTAEYVELNAHAKATRVIACYA